MGEELQTILELCRDPMAVVEDRRLSYLNQAAKAAFGAVQPGDRAEKLLPGELLDWSGENTVFCARVGETDYTVRCAQLGERRVLSFGSEDGRRDDLLSDGLLSRLLSELFNLRIGTDRLMELEAPDRNTMLWRLTARRSLFAMDRQLGDLRLAKCLRDGTYPCQVKTVELVSYCEELIEIVRSVTEGSGVQLRLEAASPELLISADPELLERTLLNLISNAYAVTERGGVIRMSLSRTARGVRISVSDNGGGIRPEVLNSVFHRAAVPATPEDLSPARSAGLGLSIVFGAVKLSGGTVMIENRPGDGTSVHILLPLSGKTLDMEDAHKAPRPSAELVRMELVDFTPLEGFSDLFWD
ncbi:MAG: hypothetical protein IJR65_07515 [Oscillospiraceae bacterium]|nr:hypothetical protein [Oscillospiraceae bacterium]